jgi:hypothetical protein
MLKKFSITISFLFLSVIPFLSHAQIVEWSNQTKVKSKTFYSQVLGENTNGVYLVRCKNSEFRKDITVEKYKPNLALELSFELPIPSNSILEKLVLLENNILFFYIGKNYTSGKIELNCMKLDLYFNPVSTPVTICDVDANQLKDNSNFYIKASADKSKLALVYIHSNGNRGSSTLVFQSFNDQLVTTSKKEIANDYEVNDAFFSSMDCNNDGDIFSVIDFPRNIKRNRANDPRNFILFAFYPLKDKLVQYEIGRDSLFINDIGLAVNNFNKSLCITGFFSYKQDNTVAGEFYYLIDASTSLVKTSNFENLSKNFVAKVASSMQNESTPILSDIYIRKIIPHSDGGCLTIAEKYYETKQSYTYYVNGFPQTSYRIMYNFDEIILISKNADGSTQFKDYIKKNQATMSDAGYYSSFVTISGNDKIGLVYNSDASNEGDVMVTTISNKGTVDTKVLVKAQSYFVQLMPGESKQVSANSSLICTLKDKRFSIMRLTF